MAITSEGLQPDQAPSQDSGQRGAEKGEDERNPPDSVSTHHHVQTLQRPQRGGATASLPFKRNTHFFWFTLTQIHSDPLSFTQLGGSGETLYRNTASLEG